MHTRPEGASEDVARVAARAIEVFTSEGDDVGLAQAWRHLSRVHLISSRWGEQTEALERALDHARRAGDRREEAMILGQLALSLYWGPTQVPEAIARCEEMLDRSGRDPTVEARVMVPLAGLEAMRGRFDRARSLYRRSQNILADLGLRPLLAAHTLALSSIEALAGTPAAAEDELRFGVGELEALGLWSSFATLASVLARTRLAQGYQDEAEQLAERARLAAPADDVASQVLWRTIRAKLLAAQGDLDDAERLAREAASLASRTDALNLHADSLVDLAEILRLESNGESAQEALREAVRLFAAKGNEISRARAEALGREAVLDQKPAAR
jgi:ATP/maltotriose-dependent transcriptional regulator MalT